MPAFITVFLGPTLAQQLSTVDSLLPRIGLMEIAYRGNMGFCEAQKHAFASWRKGFFNGKIRRRVNGEDVDFLPFVYHSMGRLVYLPTKRTTEGRWRNSH